MYAPAEAFRSGPAARCSRILLRALSKLLACVAALAGTLVALRAEAAPPFYVGLRYEVDPSTQHCWDAAEFTRSVARAVGYDPFRSRNGMSVEVRVTNATGSLRGSVIWTDASGGSIGERRFAARDGDCPKLLRELSFAVALQIDLLRPETDELHAVETEGEPVGGNTGSQLPSPGPAASKPGSGGGAPSQTSAAEAQREPRSPGRPAPQGAGARRPPERAAALRFSVGLGPSLAWRLSPSVTGQGRLFVGARLGDVSAEISAEATVPVVEKLGGGSGFRQSLAGGSAALCGHRGAFGACVLGKMARLSVTGLDVDEPRSPAALVGQAGARLTTGWELSDTWWLSPHIDALVLLTPREVAMNAVTVWEMPVFSLSAGIDLIAHF